VQRFLVTLALFGLVVGCGGESKPSGEGASSAATADDGCGCGCGCGCGEEDAGGGTYTPDKGTAAVKGMVKFEGDPPRRRPLDLGAEEFCVNSHSKEPLLTETVVVGEGGGLANVYVHVTEGLGGWKFAKGEGKVVLNQQGCQYLPHLLGAQAGQTLTIRNSDPIMHNVHGINMATKRDVFNHAQAKQGLENDEELRKPMMIFVKCDVHGWMGAHLIVEKHPFFAVTGEDGAFSLAKLPPGTYTIEAWHEKLGTQKQTVTLGDGETKEISFRFSGN